jgi:hypothetical protein
MTNFDMHDIALTTLDANGSGTASAGPAHHGEIWTITGVTVNVSTVVKEAQAFVYRSTNAGPFNVAYATLIGTTATGSSGGNFGPNITMYPGQILVARWANGDASVGAVMTYWGTRSLP